MDSSQLKTGKIKLDIFKEEKYKPNIILLLTNSMKHIQIVCYERVYFWVLFPDHETSAKLIFF